MRFSAPVLRTEIHDAASGSTRVVDLIRLRVTVDGLASPLVDLAIDPLQARVLALELQASAERLDPTPPVTVEGPAPWFSGDRPTNAGTA